MRRALVMAVFVWLIMQAITLPWAIRNYKAFGAWMPYGYAQFRDLYGTLNPSVKDVRSSTTYPQVGEDGYSPEWELALLYNDKAAQKYYANKLMREYVIGHPAHFITNGFKKLYYFMVPVQRGVWPLDNQRRSVGVYRPSFKLASLVSYAVLFIISLIGVPYAIFRKGHELKFQVLLLFLFGYIGLHFIIYPETKYRYPIEPIMMMFTSYFLVYRHEHKRCP